MILLLRMTCRCVHVCTCACTCILFRGVQLPQGGSVCGFFLILVGIILTYPCLFTHPPPPLAHYRTAHVREMQRNEKTHLTNFLTQINKHGKGTCSCSEYYVYHTLSIITSSMLVLILPRGLYKLLVIHSHLRVVSTCRFHSII